VSQPKQNKNSPGSLEFRVRTQDRVLHRDLVTGGRTIRDDDDHDGLLEPSGAGGAEHQRLEDFLVERGAERGQA